MRPIDKGSIPPGTSFTKYNEARPILAGRIGYYCSYCEMDIHNMGEVEHMLPAAKFKNQKLNWNNFLLSCKYCNTNKNDCNDNLTDYLWPDRDNTDLAFSYDKGTGVTPQKNVPCNIQLAENTIDLTKLNRFPGGPEEPTKCDTRWISRQTAWDSAESSYKQWMAVKNGPTEILQAMAKVIAIASKSGHYSVFMSVFKNEPKVKDAIDELYRTEYHLYKEFDTNGKRIVRPNGQL